VTCDGNLSGGVSFGAPVNTLNVNNLSGANAGTVSLDRSGGNGGGGGSAPAQGGDGGNGGSGSGATVNYTGGAFNIVTGGVGISAQSNGGNGGSGGDGVGFTVPIPLPPFVAPVPGFGGDGGNGGHGGTVIVTSNGNITTTGNGGVGILALANAGNGGNGGDSISILSVYGEGGEGGQGGSGGNVTVNNNGIISTLGNDAYGILATSRGGIGGSGGDAGGLVAVGGAGAGTGPGGIVNVTSTNTITTQGLASHGIFAQSIGGFAGSGGGGGGLIGFGGSGESAGDGRTVTVTNSGSITTNNNLAYGILVQSIGGGGGAGGAGGGLVGLGGSGDAGGAGGTVTVNNNAGGSINTSGSDAIGIFAQSVGGGGGDGGNSVGLVSIGGGASTTSAGGTVTVNNSQAIATTGDRSNAILAQSIGGGGGNGGTSVGVVSIGGSGGGGGNGSAVSVSNSGNLTTAGADAAALFAQSVGGGGGNGGNSFAVGLGGSLAIGGSGAVGGSASTVVVNQTTDANLLAAANIGTQGDNSHGIQAQSIGGGGGNGGLAISGAIGGGFAAAVALGGEGGPGGSSDSVVVNEKGVITTGGNNAHGIFAQSVGGGGGSGGGSVAVAASGGYSLGFSMGGAAGVGGTAGVVTVNAVGSIATTGNLSHGVFAQSVGGGGGNGGFSVAATAGAMSGSLGLGGEGAGGASGNTVTVNVTGTGFVDPTISTTGTGSVGILAQSVGGGGGNGGFAGTLGIGGGAVSVGLGGSGGDGSVGGTVNLHNEVAITTMGDTATGILAQSIGGGGGNGGFALAGSGGVVGIGAAIGGGGGAGSNGGIVNVFNSGNIVTAGKKAYGIQAQSIGGGGGNGGFAISGAVGISVQGVPAGAAAIAVGGTGGTASNGNSVFVNNTGSIETKGSSSHAVFAQSVGGGGGTGGFAGSLAVAVGNGAALGASFGGSGGTGGNGGIVDVTSTGEMIITREANADGIHAQSIGGGGGDGGFALSGTIALGEAASVALAFGGDGAAAGDGDTVTVDNQSDVLTFGPQSHGILAQSVGGGGGSGGFSVSGGASLKGDAVALSFGGSGANGGNGGSVEVANVGSIMTQGDGSYGILAQSVGGGGGAGGFSGALGLSLNGSAMASSYGGSAGDGTTAGDVSITHKDGDVLTLGDNAIGIFAQSVGGSGGTGGFSLAAAGSLEGSAESSSVGGTGGFGGTSGVVVVGGLVTDHGTGTVTPDAVTGTVTTSGAMAHGIQAQSIGGGGGNGGFSVGLSFSLDDDAKGSSVGGDGAGGGNANRVEVYSDAAIATGGVNGDGAGSHGIFAQSVGGGGGSGGFSAAGALSMKGKAASSSVGGSGARAGVGETVKVVSGGTILTTAANSYGILAQSIGGGGGNGAFSLSLGASAQGEVKSDSVGGSGGAAGAGGNVDVDVFADINTFGDLSYGVFAQSVGGGGGNGGFSIGAGGSLEADSQVSSVGGSGSGGGNGGQVTVNVGSDATDLGTPIIHTRGAGAIGVLAQSVGGGGGNGGFSGGLSIAPGGSADNTVGGGDGAGGGLGGDGGEIRVNNWGTIVTEGTNAAGVFAQSVGGGGGNGGFAIGAGLSESGGASNTVGGSAGGGGIGQLVRVDNFGAIMTSGDFSHGIIAQSIGGGGGNGGFAVSGTMAIGNGGTKSKVGGGNGGGGGAGGNVIVNNEGTIVVEGRNAFGVFAQSVGGGGGSGGFAGGLAVNGQVENAVGGEGAAGGDGGDVTVTSTGSIVTTQANSSAVFAQSVGGGGGWGGFSIGVGTSGSGLSGLSLGLGSTGGLLGVVPVDGTPGIVTVDISGGTTQTDGSLSYGLLAQSIGAGGGASGTVIEGILTFTGSDVAMMVGSDGFLPGNGTLQTTDYMNDASTTGLGAIGLISQSIGGGGGVEGLVVEDELVLNPLGNDLFDIQVGGSNASGDNGGSGGGFDLTAGGIVTTTNDNAIGVLAQNIGGGGGVGNITVNTMTNAATSYELRLGGSQTAQGDAGGPTSTVTAEEQITTEGALSHGLVAQAIGGGGGVANTVFQNGATVTNGATVQLGSDTGGGGGNGGAVTATAESGVETNGAGAFGIIAQSIGGGGGLAGFANNGQVFGQDGFTFNQTSGDAVEIIAGDAPNGSGGAVSVLANGDVRTTGFGAHGIVAQSVGGGGGIVGAGAFSASLGTEPFAGSVGGTGSAGTVSVATTYSVIANSEDSYGIFAQSSSASLGTNGDITVNVSNAGNGVGLVWGGFGDGAGVVFEGGTQANTLTSDGTIYATGNTPSPSGLPLINGLAISGAAGGEAITNSAYTFASATDYGVDFFAGAFGTRTSAIIGNVDLGGGDNSMLVEDGALFISEAFVEIDGSAGPANGLTIDGLLSPGDRGRVQVTNLSGNYTQTATGQYFIDVDLNQQNTGNEVTDRLEITGSAEVAGEGPLLLMSINKKFNEYVIVDAPNGTVTDNGFEPTLTPSGVGFDFNVRVDPSGGGEALVLYADKPTFGTQMLTDPGSGTTDPNVWRMGVGLDNVEAAIDTDDPFNYLVNLLRLSPDLKTLGDAVVTLTPHNAPHIYEITRRRSSDFLDAAIDCPYEWQNGAVGDKRNCLWVQGSYGEYHRGIVYDSPSNDDDWSAITLGGQFAVDPNWQVGFGFEATDVDSVQTWQSTRLSDLSADIYHFSLSANYQSGPFTVALVTAGSHGEWNSRRWVNIDGYSQQYTTFEGIDLATDTPIYANNTTVFEGVNGTAVSSTDVTGFSQLLRLSYLQNMGGLEVIPFFDVEGHVLRTSARTETGVGLANLTYRSQTETTITFTPGLELALVGNVGAQSLVRGFVRGGVEWAPDNEWAARTQFAAAPAGVPDIKIKERFDDATFKVDAGVMLIDASGFEVNVNYSGAFGEAATENEVRGGATFKY
jgi:hypothetical protein